MKPWVPLFPITLLFATPWTYAGNTIPYQQAKETQVKQCLSTVDSSSNNYLEYANHGADSNWNSDSPDKRLLSFFVSKGYFWGDSQVNMQFVPNSAGGCDVVFTETFVAEKECATVQEEKFARWKVRGDLNGKTIVLQNERGDINVYLTPAGMAKNLCMVTRREVSYS